MVWSLRSFACRIAADGPATVALTRENCMAMTRRRAILPGSTAFGLPSVTRAQMWPTGPVTLVVGYATGAGPDNNARGLAKLGRLRLQVSKELVQDFACSPDLVV